MSVKFGTSGLRGLSAELIGLPTALHISAFCRYLLDAGLAQAGSPLLVGQDLRPSSPEIASVAFGAIAEYGFDAIDCGLLLTPALALAAMAQRAPCIMITGSHIPADRNGIKFYVPSGEISKEDEGAISAWAQKLTGTVTVKHAKGVLR